MCDENNGVPTTVAQVEMLKDSTLKIDVDVDVSKVGRILLCQNGTCWGGLYYPDVKE